MAIRTKLSEVGSAISSKGQEATNKAKELAATAEVKSKITAAENSIRQLSIELGEKILKEHSDWCSANYPNQLGRVNELNANIAQYNQDIEKLKQSTLEANAAVQEAHRAKVAAAQAESAQKKAESAQMAASKKKERKQKKTGQEELQTVITAEGKGKKKIPFILAGIALVLVLGIVLGVTAYNGSDTVKVRQQLNLGNKYLDELDFERAVMAYNAVLEIDPKNAEAYIGMADAYAGMGEWEKALQVLEDGYALTGEEVLTAKMKEIREREYVKGVGTGEIITFGHYEQDNDTSNGAEPIEWVVLTREEGRALVVSLYALDCKLYNEKYTDVTWETCTLRAWLNDSFYNTAFDTTEKGKIVQVTNANPDSYDFWQSNYAKEHYYSNEGANGGNATVDNIFLLSWEEALNYFASDNARRCNPSAYAIAQGAWSSTGDSTGRCCWWLRSPGVIQLDAVDVNYDGALYSIVVYRGDAVRPALWIAE